MEHSGSEAQPNHVIIDNETTREFTQPEMAKLAVYLAFEDAMTSADERLTTRDEAISYMQTLAPVILQRGTA